MKIKNKKLSLICALAFCLMLLMAVPVQAKTAKYKSLYNKFLAKGTFTVKSTSYGFNYRTGKINKYKSTAKYKISKYAVVNLDGKGSPELLLFTRYYSGKNAYNPYDYYVTVAYVKGNKVKLAKVSEYIRKVNGKSYKSTSYITNFMLKNDSSLQFSKSAKVLRVETNDVWYDDYYKKARSEEYVEYYELKNSMFTERYSDEDELEENKSKLGLTNVKILANNKKNRKKSFK